MEELQQQVQAGEQELVEKTAAIARLSIQATLATRVAETKEDQEDPFEAALGQVQGKLRDEREVQEALMPEREV